jgi:hypothetical protein
MRTKVFWGGALAAAVSLAAACVQTDTAQTPTDALLANESFVPIARPQPSAVGEVRRNASSPAASGSSSSDGNNDFYLAISKKELGQRWFLSAFVSNIYPGQVNSGAAASLGTRVVSFKVQNGKLYVFDVADTRKTSDLFDPEVLVEAYPIVDHYSGFEALPNHDNYVLFDPSAGLNKFSLISDLYSDWYLGSAAGLPVQVGVSYMQGFRKIADGVTYQQVFSASGGVAGTLGIALRKYTEGKGYTPTSYPVGGNFYFPSDEKLVPNSGGGTSTAIHWNMKKGAPITYYITPTINQFDQQFPNAKVIDAVKEGVTNWNQVFGYEALRAEVAKDNSVVGEDDKNVIMVDPDPSMGYAFSDWRSNPNTGEIRGVSIYLGGVWFDDSQFQKAPPPSSGTASATPPPKPLDRKAGPTILWGPLHNKPACVLWAPKYRVDGVAAAAAGGPAAPGAPMLTPDQQFHNWIVSVVVHEVGHTLGLRHNFKGSLAPPSSSVMDYLNTDDSVATPNPQAFDVDAIKYLYGMSTDEPQQAFCTDEDTSWDPDCAVFDHGKTPMTDDWGPSYAKWLGVVQQVGWGTFFDFLVDMYLNGVLGYVRAGSDDVATAAYAIAMGPAAPPAAADVLAQPGGPDYVDGLAARVLERLYLDDAAYQGYITGAPASSKIHDLAVRDLSGMLANSDGARSFNTRRMVVDILKGMQTDDAYAALQSARVSIAAGKAGLAAEAQAQTDDLLARIDAATHPYFIH